MGLCASALIAVLLTTRLDDIAHFAVLSPSWTYVIEFVLLQIPYILPIVIPISCLISSILLVQRLSKSHELTAFRACGISLKDFLTPILFSAVLISIVNFFIVSELATYSHFQTNVWKEELRSMNPLFLLSNKRLMKVRGGFYRSLGQSQTGKNAEHAIFALPNNNQLRISLFLARKLIAKGEVLEGRDVSLVTTLPPNQENLEDQLIIENMAFTRTLTGDFSQLMKKKQWKISCDYLTMEQLLAHLHEERKKAAEFQSSEIKKRVNQSYSEIIRRFSVGIAAFTFTLLGVSFGISINRTQSLYKIFAVIFLAGLYITAFFLGKGVDYNLELASSLYIVPHILIILISVIILNRVSKGIE